MQTHTFFLHLLVLLLTARFFAEVAGRLKVPPVIGELLAGVVLGPSLLGWLAPTDVIKLLAEIGIILLLFEVGLETDVRQLVRTGTQAVVVATAGFILPFLLGFGLSRTGLGLDLLPSLFVGGTLTATSIGITVRVLTDLKRQQSREGQVVLGAAVLDDVLGVVLLALLYEFSVAGGVSLVNTAKVLFFIALFFVLAPPLAKLLSALIHRFDRVSDTPGLLPTTLVALVLFFAWLAHAVGAPELLGGFAAGLALSRRFFLPLGIALKTEPDFAHRVEEQMRPIVHLFTPIFFVMVGLSLNLREIDWGSPFIWTFSISLVAVAVIGKLAGAWLLRESWPVRWAIGLAMTPRGEVGLIFAELGRTSGIFDNEVYAGMVMVIAFTTLLPPLLMRWFYGRYGPAMDLPEAGAGTAEETTPWHALTVSETSRRLGVPLRGLSRSEALERLERLGPNRLTPPRRRGPMRRFLTQFHNVLIYVLLGAAVLTASLAHWVDTGVILAVVLINALIGFVQEGKAEEALDAIRQMLSLEAVVVREGKQVAIHAHEAVPGDIVVLQAGDRVPADLRLFWVKDLRIDEATLTGESVPVEKGTAPLPEATPLGDRRCMAYAGTYVTYGQGLSRMVARGDDTEIGRISALLGRIETLTTPLLRQLARFGRWLTLAILSIATATSLFGILVQGFPETDMFLAAVGLAVAAIPEGLPAIMTIALAIGVRRMARRHAIIRRLPAVETLGAVTVICTDKTGTLTRNEMAVRSLVTADAVLRVSGGGLSPHGQMTLEGREIPLDDPAEVIEMGRAGLLCNDAALTLNGSDWVLRGDPTEGALVALAMKAGLDAAIERERLPRTDVIPFESERRFMATLHHDHAGHAFMYLKGAPERVFALCHAERVHGTDRPLDRAYWDKQVAIVARRGERPLAIAFKAMAGGRRSLSFEDTGGGLTLLGVFGIADPPREEAIAAVRKCQAAGIRIKMITGDHALTAGAIAKEIGIGPGEHVLTGAELDALTDDELRARCHDIDVFARASPEHKLRLVQSLQVEQHVVAMTGDGVNDAPALKRADVGIAMGRRGTEVAKAAAEVVLTDDNFASIAHAVEEGRTVYDNLKKAIIFILPTNGGEAMMLIVAILMGEVLPITPAQILWVNTVTTVTLALALAFEPPERDVMRYPPRPPSEPILSRFLIWRIVFVSLIMVAGTFGLFDWYFRQGVSVEHARTVAVNTLVMFEAFYLLNTRYLRTSVLSHQGLFGNRWVPISIATVIAFQLLFTYAAPLQGLFGTRDLGFAEWAWILLVASTVFFLVELERGLVSLFEHARTHSTHL